MSNEEETNVAATQDPSPQPRNYFLLKSIAFLILAGALAYVGYTQLIAKLSATYNKNQQTIEQMQAGVTEMKNAVQAQQQSLQKITEDYLHLQETVQKLEQTQLAQGSRGIDVKSIYARLLSLNEKIDQLPLMNKPVMSSQQINPATTEANLSWWQKGLNQTWESLRSVVVVRYNQSDKIPLVPPDLHVYLYQNWHAMLMHAMSALLLGEADIYRSSLQQAEAWVKQYCVAESPITQAFLTELSQLQAVDVSITKPNAAAVS